MQLRSIAYSAFSTNIGQGFFDAKALERRNQYQYIQRGCTSYRIIIVETYKRFKSSSLEKPAMKLGEEHASLYRDLELERY